MSKLAGDPRHAAALHEWGPGTRHRSLGFSGAWDLRLYRNEIVPVYKPMSQKRETAPSLE